MMKKTLLALLMVFALAVLMTSIAAAENDTNTTLNETVDVNTTVTSNETLEEDINETIVMRTVYGAQVRLLQLEKSIERNVLTGQEILEQLNGTNTSELEAILEQLQGLQEEVAAYEIPEDYSSQVALDYVALKAEARDLSREFHDLVHELASPEQVVQLREAAMNRERQVMQAQRNELQNAVRMYNTKQFEQLQQRLGLNLTDVQERYQQGQMDMRQARQEVKDHLKAFGQEQRQGAMQRMHEDAVRANVAREQVREQLPQHTPRRGR